MNTTDYFTNINAMFLFCIFTCGLLVWAVIRGYILKGKLTKEQDGHLKATLINTKLNKALEDEKKVSDNMEKLLRQVETEVRDLQSKLDHAEADRIELRAERATLENKVLELTNTCDDVFDTLVDAVAKIPVPFHLRKRDDNGKFAKNSAYDIAANLMLRKSVNMKRFEFCNNNSEASDIDSLMVNEGDELSGDQPMKIEVTEIATPKLEATKAKVRKRDKDGKFLPSGNARPKRVKKVKSAVNELTDAFDQIKADSPKLVHGMTVKNPTEDERED